VNDVNLARYYISNYRYHRENYNFADEVFAVRVGNTNIMVAYQLK
jgi:hypothetical protein